MTSGRDTMRSASMFNVSGTSVKGQGQGQGQGSKDDEEGFTSAATFEIILPNICTTFNCPRPVIVRKEVQKDDFVKMLKKPEVPKKPTKIKFIPAIASIETGKTAVDSITSLADTSYSLSDPSMVVVSAIYDNQDNLVEIALNKTFYVPRMVLQGIALLVPYLDKLQKFTIKSCKIDAYALHELQKIQSAGNITEITLENIPYLGGELARLLEHDVRNLTLCRCNIDDTVCEQIASKLCMYQVAEMTLQCLNLSSNKITDLGVKYLAGALRTNRTLRSLNLADNQITDEGAALILNVLNPFPLTKDELLAMRTRYTKYLRKRIDLVKKYFNTSMDQIESHINLGPTFSIAKKKKGSSTTMKSLKKENNETNKSESVVDIESFKRRAEVTVGDIMGPFKDPFNKTNTIKKDDWVYCRGNMALASLNLSYNKMSYFILKPIEKMLIHQERHKMLNETGLVRLVIEGNRLPMGTTEMENINNILTKTLEQLSGRQVGSASARSTLVRRKSSKLIKK